MRRQSELVCLGRPAGPAVQEGAGINLPVYRASTIVYADLESYEGRLADGRQYDKVVYGSAGTQNAHAFAEAVTALEGGYRTTVTASGLSAVTLGLSAFVGTGDHILVADSVYGPTRSFCTSTLARFGVEVSFFDAREPRQIDELARKSTRCVFLETPSSWCFDVHDVPEIVRRSKALGMLVLLDNTWATPLYYKPLSLGVDVVIHAGTKYLSGHSDLVIGTITAKDEQLFRCIADHVMGFGDVSSPDDCALALRGLRTLAVRLEHQARSALKLAHWLEARPEVSRVLYPALPSHPGHELWKRDFSGASSLFSLALARSDRRALGRVVNGLSLFRIGSSYGGYSSLVSVASGHDHGKPGAARTGPLLRLHVGLEDVDDLIEDLAAALARLDSVGV